MASERPESRRERITREFARWIATCAIDKDALGVSDDDLYAALDRVNFEPLFDDGLGAVIDAEFGDWHERAVDRMRGAEPKLGAGWAAKMVNEYLKTTTYVGGFGRTGLADVIHPPVDDGLTRGLKKHFARDTDLREMLGSVVEMRRMKTYPQYDTLIRACRRVARLTGCSLLEVELFWD